MTQNQKEIVGVHGLVNSSATHHSRLPRIVLLFLVLSLYNSFSLPLFSSLSHFLSYVLPFSAPHTFLPPFRSLSHCLIISFCCFQYISCLLFVFPLWVLVPSSVSHCFCFLNSFPYFWLISPHGFPSLSYSLFPGVPFLFHFPLHFIAHCFSIFCQFFYLHFAWAIFSQ